MTSGEFIEGGYVLLPRRLFESEEWFGRSPLHRILWVYLFAMANHSLHNGLARGQIRTSLPVLQEALSYMAGYRLIKPSRRSLWLSLEGLRERHAIVTMKVTHGLIITICNYDRYQTAENYERHGEKPTNVMTGGQRTSQHGHNVYKNVKNKEEGKEREETPSPADAGSDVVEPSKKPKPPIKGTFDRFWKLYPRKVGKGQAERAWAGALKKASAETIIEAIKTQLPILAGREKQFVPHPATWLNGQRWADDVDSIAPTREQSDPSVPKGWYRGQDGELHIDPNAGPDDPEWIEECFRRVEAEKAADAARLAEKGAANG